MNHHRIYLASQNAHKAEEFNLALQGLAIEVHNAPNALEVEENAPDFQGNALLKAKAYSDYFQVSALADDSGLCVDALGGAPGVHSARYANEGDASLRDAANNRKLVEALRGLPASERGAEFVCSLALILRIPDASLRFTSFSNTDVSVTVNDASVIVECTGRARGVILEQALGRKGFGYDPLFYVPEMEQTFAQISPEEKLRLSHRGKAIRRLTRTLQALGLEGF